MTSGIPKLKILIGLPGSWKSTYAKEEKDQIKKKFPESILEKD